MDSAMNGTSSSVETGPTLQTSSLPDQIQINPIDTHPDLPASNIPPSSPLSDSDNLSDDDIEEEEEEEEEELDAEGEEDIDPSQPNVSQTHASSRNDAEQTTPQGKIKISLRVRDGDEEDDIEDDASSITSSTIPLSEPDNDPEDPEDPEEDEEMEIDDQGQDTPGKSKSLSHPVNKAALAFRTVKPINPEDSDASELTEDSEGEKDEGEEDEEEEEEEEEGPEHGSVPPPNSNNNNKPKSQILDPATVPTQGKPPSTHHQRKPSIFGPQPTDSLADDDNDLSELEEESDSELPSVPKNTNGTVLDDGEKPYSPPKSGKKTGLGMGIVPLEQDGEESTFSEEEEEDEGGEGMLMKDVVRRESEGKIKGKKDSEGDEEEAEKGEERQAERAASPSSIKSKRNNSTAHSTTSHLITNQLSSATPQTTLEALQALLQIEIKFAALRDQLYVERMDELSREEEIIADGSHPSLLHLHQILHDRRENLLHLAELRLKQNELELARVRDSDKKAVMSWWQDAKDTLIRDEYNDNARKKRRLDKDKADYETIKPPPKALPPKIPTRQDVEARTFAWNRGPSITALQQEEVSNDLAKIGIAARAQYRQLHGHGHRQQGHGMSGFDRTGHQLGFPQEDPGHMVDTGSLMFDPNGGSRAINGSASHHHHHVVPTGSNQSTPRHRHYASPAVYDMMAPRREGRQVPTTSLDPFDARRRDRVDDPMNAVAGPSRDRSRKELDEPRDPKRRKTDSNSPVLVGQQQSQPHRNGMDMQRQEPDARIQEGRRMNRRSPSPTTNALNGHQTHPKAVMPDPVPAAQATGSGGYNQMGGYNSSSMVENRGWPYRFGPDHRKQLMPGMAAARN